MTEDSIYKKEKRKQGKRENLKIPYQNNEPFFSEKLCLQSKYEELK